MEAMDAQEWGVEVPPGYCIVWMGAQYGSSGISVEAMAVVGGASAPCTGEMSAAVLEGPVASLAGELV